MSVSLSRDQALVIFRKARATIADGAKHYKVTLEIEGRQVFRTLLSRSSKDSIPIGTAYKILRDIGLSNNKSLAMELRDCTKGPDDYLTHIQRSEAFKNG